MPVEMFQMDLMFLLWSKTIEKNPGLISPDKGWTLTACTSHKHITTNMQDYKIQALSNRTGYRHEKAWLFKRVLGKKWCSNATVNIPLRLNKFAERKSFIRKE